MRGPEQPNSDQSKRRRIVIHVDKDGNISLPRDCEEPLYRAIAEEMKDTAAIAFFDEAVVSEVVLGKRRCG